ncbi:hypothetical protein [Hymenobacter cellulosivorans]|uniref:Uncharacterized protein n=1 Tax=Hymenobacter cellulosivorans TaxID=2932249 RepID=A0ABY4F2J4_9BACT|nr:hypothetical protein [Hymenobacter cellulosivorans]UOQ50890.1 hypothetical protein MUN80_14100 [Hymenobacter cellulosivorans]
MKSHIEIVRPEAELRAVVSTFLQAGDYARHFTDYLTHPAHFTLRQTVVNRVQFEHVFRLRFSYHADCNGIEMKGVRELLDGLVQWPAESVAILAIDHQNDKKPAYAIVGSEDLSTFFGASYYRNGKVVFEPKLGLGG